MEGEQSLRELTFRWAARIIGGGLLAVGIFAATQDAKDTYSGHSGLKLDLALMLFGALLLFLTVKLGIARLAPRTCPPGELMPLAWLQEAFTGFDVKQSDFIKRDGKLFRVNSTGLQVQVNDLSLWKFQFDTGEFLRPLKKKRAGHNMIQTATYKERLASYEGKKQLAYLSLFLVPCATAIATAFFGIIAVFLASQSYFIGAFAAVTALLGVVALVSVGLRRDIKLRTWSDEYILGPQPLRRLVEDYGDRINTRPPAPSAASDDYQIPS